jgi:hypothetical protein
MQPFRLDVREAGREPMISACGTASFSAGVRIPVPAAVSRMRVGWRRAVRSATSLT